MSFDMITSGYPGVDYIMPVNRAPRLGETSIILAPPPLKSPYLGGCALNIAVGGARLGLHTATIALIGDDSTGEHILQKLRDEGVDTSFGVHVIKGGKTAITFLFLNPDDRHQTFYYPGVSDQKNITLHLPRAKLQDTAWGVIAVGNFIHNQQVLETFANNGLHILWTHKDDVRAFPKSFIRRLSETSEIVVLNSHEAEVVRKALGLKDIRDLLLHAPRAVILTKGDQSSNILTAKSEIHVQAVIPKATVDPTGAGDGFTAGLLFGLCHNLTLETACQIGAVTASFVLEDWGCQTNLPNVDQLKRRYQQAFEKKLDLHGELG